MTASPPPRAPDDALPALETALGRLFRGVRRARGHGNQHLRDGVSLPQFHLLEPLLTHPDPLPVGRLAELAHTTPPTATTMIRSLAERGLVERSADPRDRRVVRVALTPEGRAEVEAWAVRISDWRRRLVSAIDPDDHAAALRVIGVLADEVDRAVQEFVAGQ